MTASLRRLSYKYQSLTLFRAGGTGHTRTWYTFSTQSLKKLFMQWKVIVQNWNSWKKFWCLVLTTRIKTHWRHSKQTINNDFLFIPIPHEGHYGFTYHKSVCYYLLNGVYHNLPLFVLKIISVFSIYDVIHLVPFIL